MNRWWIVLFLACAWMGMAAQGALADESPSVTKLRRGFANAAFGWVEFFGRIKNEGPHGALTGIVGMIRREGVGLTELLTFPVGMPKSDFSPLVRPEWPMEAWRQGVPEPAR